MHGKVKDNIQQKLKKLADLKAVVKDAFPTEDEKVEEIISLQKDLIEETRLRMQLQSLLDFGELIESFVKECYPEWAGNRRPRTYTKAVWQYVFLNIEHPRVLFLKKDLQKSGITEESFRDVIDIFLKGRNGTAQTNYRMAPKEREASYPALLKEMNRLEKVVVRVILSFSYDFKGSSEIVYKPLSDSSTPNPDDAKVIEEISKQTQEKRKSIRLLELPDFPTYGISENDVERAFTGFIQKYFDESNFKKIEALAFFNLRNKAFILFDSFESAYTIYKKIEFYPSAVYGIPPQQFEHMILRSVNDTKIYNSLAELKISEIEIPPNPDKTYAKSWSYQDIINEFKNEKIVPFTEIKQYTRTKNGETIFFRFPTLESTLIAYQKIKRMLRIEDIKAEATLTEIPSSYNTNMYKYDWEIGKEVEVPPTINTNSMICL